MRAVDVVVQVMSLVRARVAGIVKDIRHTTRLSSKPIKQWHHRVRAQVPVHDVIHNVMRQVLS